MISDVLSEAVDRIDEYLGDEAFETAYAGDLRARIVTVRDQMDALRWELDSPPEEDE